MKKDIEELKAYVTRLRADLAATNATLFAVIEAIPIQYQHKALLALAARSAGRQAHAEQLGIQGTSEAIRLVQAAEDRMYQELQKVHTKAVRDSS